MFHIQRFILGPLQTNAYLLANESTREAIVIDPGLDPTLLLKALTDWQVKAILLTHAHFDHIGGLEAVRTAHHCPVYIHQQEEEWLTTPERNGSLRWSQFCPPIITKPAEHFLQGGDKLQFIGSTFHVLHTPGHSPGSVSFLCDQHVFSGDALFRTAIGRTDLPGGHLKQLLASIHEQLFLLDDNTVVYPGHGEQTTIIYEKQHNPFV